MFEEFPEGSYAPFVWAAYALTSLVLMGFAGFSIRRYFRLKRTLENLTGGKTSS